MKATGRMPLPEGWKLAPSATINVPAGAPVRGPNGTKVGEVVEATASADGDHLIVTVDLTDGKTIGMVEMGALERLSLPGLNLSLDDVTIAE